MALNVKLGNAHNPRLSCLIKNNGGVNITDEIFFPPEKCEIMISSNTCVGSTSNVEPLFKVQHSYYILLFTMRSLHVEFDPFIPISFDLKSKSYLLTLKIKHY